MDNGGSVSWRFELVDVIPMDEQDGLPWVWVVRKTFVGGGDNAEDGDSDGTDQPPTNTVVRKHLVHFTRLRDYAISKGLEPPALSRVGGGGGGEGEGGGGGGSDAAIKREDVAAFLEWISDRLCDGSLASSEAEVQQFMKSSVPKESAWGPLDACALSAPKVRRVFVDVSILEGQGLVGGPLDSFFSVGADPDSFFVILSCGVQRFCSDVVRSPIGCPQWVGQDATFTVVSVAEWIDCTVMCQGGLMGAPLLVGVARIPVFPFTFDGSAIMRECPLIDVRTPAAAVCGTLTLKISAHFLASKCHLQGTRGPPIAALPMRVDTGDMIFFKSKRLLAGTTRLFTWSDWDHVGIVIGGKRLRLLEAVSDVGVVLRDLDSTIELYKGACTHIGFRRLCNVERTSFMAERALRYAQETRGLPYNWSIPDMITTSVERKPAKAMFCSQLVVEMLQRIEVINDASVIPDNYLPGTLADVKKSACVAADAMIRFSGWEGETVNMEAAFVEMARKRDYPFGVFRATLNAAWKGRSRGTLVTIVGSQPGFGLMIIEDGSTVPAAFVDLQNNDERVNE